MPDFTYRCEALPYAIGNERDIWLSHRVSVAFVLTRHRERGQAVHQPGPAQVGVVIETLAVEQEDGTGIGLRLILPLGLRGDPEELAFADALAQRAVEPHAVAELPGLDE